MQLSIEYPEAEASHGTPLCVISCETELQTLLTRTILGSGGSHYDHGSSSACRLAKRLKHFVQSRYW